MSAWSDPVVGRSDDPDLDDVEARRELARVVEPGDERVAQVVGELGPIAAVQLLRRGPTSATPPAAVRWRSIYAERLAALEGDGERFDEQLASSGVRFVVPGDEEWPSSLDDLGRRAPLGLFVRGSARLDVDRRVAVVGARASTAYGEHVAADFAAGLATRRWTVVSGGAYGIDASAHRGALAAGGTTVAVLACGVDVAYPAGHAHLFAAIAESGLLVSELPPGEHPTRSRFLLRNRLIAAISAGTVVVEAALRSGATSTVNHAIDLCRPTMGVPGPITSASSAGVHKYLRDGQAVVVTDVDEVLELLSPSGEGTLDERRGPTRRHDQLDDDDRAILDALRPRRATPSDAVADRIGLPAVEVLVRLGRLESRGFALLVEGGWVVRRGGG